MFTRRKRWAISTALSKLQVLVDLKKVPGHCFSEGKRISCSTVSEAPAIPLKSTAMRAVGQERFQTLCYGCTEQ